MKEQRKLERKNFIYDIEVVDRGKPIDEETGEHPVLGDLADITTEGVMLVTDEPVAEGVAFQLRVVLPEEMEGLNAIEFEAESIRCNETIHEAIFLTGFKITKLDEQNRSIISGFITEFAV